MREDSASLFHRQIECVLDESKIRLLELLGRNVSKVLTSIKATLRRGGTAGAIKVRSVTRSLQVGWLGWPGRLDVRVGEVVKLASRRHESVSVA